MKKYSNILIVILLIGTLIGLYCIYTEGTNKYFKSMGYLVVGLSVFGITFLKINRIHQQITHDETK